mmetsp:Transcript_58187/g.85292  ORF Transcript_58187/g.85292 Transcript_58187/m.85292 type:complete len:155 (+) Transcript_58187:118-582(+)
MCCQMSEKKKGENFLCAERGRSHRQRSKWGAGKWHPTGTREKDSKETKEQGYRILFYRRYIDDILAIFEYQDGHPKRKGAEMMERLLNGLDSQGGSITVGGKGISSMRSREKETGDESVEYLDVEIVLTGRSEMKTRDRKIQKRSCCCCCCVVK